MQVTLFRLPAKWTFLPERNPSHPWQPSFNWHVAKRTLGGKCITSIQPGSFITEAEVEA